MSACRGANLHAELEMAISKGAMSGDLEIRDFKTKKGKTCDELFCVLHKGTLLGFSDSFMLSSPVLAVPITTDTHLAGPAANTIAIDGSASTSKDLAKYYGRVAKVQASVVLVAEDRKKHVSARYVSLSPSRSKSNPPSPVQRRSLTPVLFPVGLDVRGPQVHLRWGHGGTTCGCRRCHRKTRQEYHS